MSRVLRSQAYQVDLGHGAKPWMILRNNSRNRNLDSDGAAQRETVRWIEIT